MKILILSCNTGEGHNSSGKALQAALRSRGVECDLEDTLAVRSKWLSKIVSDFYEFSIKISLFGFIYRLAEQYNALQLKVKSPIYSFGGLFAPKIINLLQSKHYDGVICVHLFPAEAMTMIRHKYGQRIPSIFVMTDYTCIPLLYETDLDKYVIPHNDLMDEFVIKGLVRGKLEALGIPINENRFTKRLPREEAQELANELFSWEEAKGKWYLIMGGSMGFGKLPELVKQLQSSVSSNDRIICICGKNDKLKQQLTKLFHESSTVKVLGYTREIPLLMDASDVLLTKPGGITSTEAIIKNIPIVHISPIKGLEEDNAVFFRNMGMSLRGNTIESQVEMATRLSHNADAQREMIEAQRQNSNQNCSNDIADLIINIAQQQHS